MLAADAALIAYRSVPGLALRCQWFLTLFLPAIGGVLLLTHDRSRWQMGAGARRWPCWAAAIASRTGHGGANAPARCAVSVGTVDSVVW